MEKDTQKKIGYMLFVGELVGIIVSALLKNYFSLTVFGIAIVINRFSRNKQTL